jgi:erythronate-4-phosphate dehydrogenase
MRRKARFFVAARPLLRMTTVNVASIGVNDHVRIVADANIPLLAQAFGPLGDVTALPADRLTPEAVRQADALLVRSVTKVNAALLEGSGVKFVATATIGVDHIDEAYLESRGIGFASAAGSNARSVAEYVLAALTVLAERGRWRLRDKTLGIVGCGNVGGRLAGLAQAAGLRVLMNDPPLARRTGDPRYLPLEALAEADIVTFHVPLLRDGPDATYHMINPRLLAMLRPGTVVLNSSRGSVAHPAALAEGRSSGRIGQLVLDVWEGEPNIDPALMERVTLATPHVAGYSYDGKVNGTRMILEALCRHFGLQRPWKSEPLMPPPARPRVRLPAGVTLDLALRQAIAASYDIETDDRRLRELARQPADRRGKFFSDLRKNYPVRREFASHTVELGSPDQEVEQTLKALGFAVTQVK